jgi:hypothetical protein
MNLFASSSGSGPRSPGQSILDRGLWRALYPFLILLFLCGVTLGAAWHPTFLREGTALWVLLGLGVALAWAGQRAERVWMRHQRGAEGEEQVARVLKTLSAEWRVFEDGEGVRDLEADHVVLGPGGLYLIETINWQGRISVEEGRLLDDGRFYPGYALDDLALRAKRFQEALPDPAVPVTPLVCAVGGRLAPMPNPNQGVWFAEMHSLLAVLQKAQGGTLSDAQRRDVIRLFEQEKSS